MKSCQFLKWIILPILAGLLTVTSVQADTIVIDDFASGVNLSLNGTSSATNDGPHAGVIGGYRDTKFTSYGNATVIYSDGLYYMSSGGYGDYTVKYDGLGTGGSLGLNLLAVGTEGYFTLENFIGFEHGYLDFKVTDGSGISQSIGFYFYNNLTNLFGPGPVSDIVLDYDIFTNYGTLVDLTDIRSIQLYASGSDPDTTFSISSITATTIPSTAVPEPASLGLLGFGGLFLLRRQRRQRLA